MPEKWGCVWARMPCPKQMAPFLCRLVVPVAGLTAAELPYCCLPAAAALQLHCVSHAHFPVYHPGYSVLPCLHPYLRAALNTSLVLHYLWVCPCPGPATSHRTQHYIHSSATSTQVLLSP